MPPTRIPAALSFLALALQACPTQAMAPAGDPAASISAVVFDRAADPAAVEVANIIAALEDNADVIVYRIALKGDDREPAASGTRPGRPVHLAYNGQAGIAVVYPDIGEPYRSVFSRIIEGIEDKAKTRVASFAIGERQNPQELASELRRQNIQVVIALGRNGLKATANLDRDIAVVVGGVLSVPEADTRGMSVFSLAPDPNLLFERLKALTPGVRRVFVVYDPRQNAWLIRLAREAARAHGIELIAQEAGDLKTAMRAYQEIIGAADTKRDAIWLPQDSVTVEDSSVLPLVLQEAWNRTLVVFSSSVAHVKRGALFSLYPNNVELGRNLASSALGQATAGIQAARAITPLKDVLMAVNVRTAGHLGLGLGFRQQQAFDMVFPEQ